MLTPQASKQLHALCYQHHIKMRMTGFSYKPSMLARNRIAASATHPQTDISLPFSMVNRASSTTTPALASRSRSSVRSACDTSVTPLPRPTTGFRTGIVSRNFVPKRRFEVSYQCHLKCDEWRQKVNKDRKEKVNLTTPI